MTRISDILKRHMYASTEDGYGKCEKELEALMDGVVIEIAARLQVSIRGASVQLVGDCVRVVAEHMCAAHTVSEREQEVVALTAANIQHNLIDAFRAIEIRRGD